ncbi:MAG: hypothetical protein LQ340_005089, partial [Diploschistes diacapsis]
GHPSSPWSVRFRESVPRWCPVAVPPWLMERRLRRMEPYTAWKASSRRWWQARTRKTSPGSWVKAASTGSDPGSGLEEEGAPRAPETLSRMRSTVLVALKTSSICGEDTVKGALLSEGDKCFAVCVARVASDASRVDQASGESSS